jgi:hypothetical protein
MVRLCDSCGRVAERGAYYHYFFGRSLQTGTPMDIITPAHGYAYAISGREGAWICTRCTGAAMVRSALFFVAGPLLLILGFLLGPNPVTGAGVLRWAAPDALFAAAFGTAADPMGVVTLAALDLFCILAGGRLWMTGIARFLVAGHENGSILAIEAHRGMHEARGWDAFFTPQEFARLRFSGGVYHP